MFKHILVPTDGSKLSLKAIDLAAALAQSTNAKVTAVTVSPTYPTMMGGDGYMLPAMVPSQWDENAPLTVLQARAAGVPVIASDVPGVREVLQPGVHGLLFPHDEPEELADAMREIILGRFPRALTPSPLISYREHLARIENVYLELVTRARGRAVKGA